MQLVKRMRAEPDNQALNCHCSQCRRATGAAFKSFADIQKAKLHITKGQGRLLIFGDAMAQDVRWHSDGYTDDAPNRPHLDSGP